MENANVISRRRPVMTSSTVSSRQAIRRSSATVAAIEPITSSGERPSAFCRSACSRNLPYQRPGGIGIPGPRSKYPESPGAARTNWAPWVSTTVPISLRNLLEETVRKSSKSSRTRRRSFSTLGSWSSRVASAHQMNESSGRSSASAHRLRQGQSPSSLASSERSEFRSLS